MTIDNVWTDEQLLVMWGTEWFSYIDEELSAYRIVDIEWDSDKVELSLESVSGGG